MNTANRQEMERYVLDAFERGGYTISGAAKVSGVSMTTVNNWIRTVDENGGSLRAKIDELRRVHQEEIRDQAAAHGRRGGRPKKGK